jgi:hypothetical protein
MPDSDDPNAVAEVPVPSMKESFDIGREDDTTMPNIWPPDHVLPGFREACSAFFWVRFFSSRWWNDLFLIGNKKCHEIEKNILRALALGFGLDEEWLVKYHGKADNGLRLQHYPRQASSFPRNQH